MIDDHAICHAAIEAHFVGRISPDKEREMREHLAQCGACTRRYERRLLLAELDPSALDARERIGRGLGILRPARPVRPLVGAMMAAAALCGLAAIMRPASLTPYSPTRELMARGSPQPEQTASLEVYHAQPGSSFEVAGDSIRASDELAFAYTNQAAYPFLAVCAVDEHGHVYWYHPAWTSIAEDPDSVRIEGGRVVRELPEAISHELDGRKIHVVGAFSARPLHVREVERVLAATEGRSLEAAFSEAFGRVSVVERTYRVDP